VVAFLLAFYNKNRFVGNYYLVGFFLVNALFGMTFYALYYSPSVKFSAIMHGHFMPVLYLSGPMIYFYVRSLVTDDSKLKKKDLLHFIPFLILFAGIIPYLFRDFSYKVALNESFRVDPSNFMTNINVLVPQSINLDSRPVIILTYYIAALWTFLSNREVIRQKSLLSGLYFKHIYRFVLTLLILSLMLSTGVLVFIVSSVYKLSSHNRLPEMSFLLNTIGWVYFLLNSSLFIFPEILYGLPRSHSHLPLPEEECDKPTNNATELSTENTLNRLQLSDEYLLRIEQEIACYLLKKPFLATEFSLTRMSEETNIPTHHLSYYFNNVLHGSFSDWRNRLRIEYAMQLMADGFAKEHSLNAVSLESGFSSQVTFIRAFKSHSGQTPGEYLKSVR
jgi:AraC-like DNA-binding protein